MSYVPSGLYFVEVDMINPQFIAGAKAKGVEPKSRGCIVIENGDILGGDIMTAWVGTFSVNAGTIRLTVKVDQVAVVQGFVKGLDVLTAEFPVSVFDDPRPTFAATGGSSIIPAPVALKVSLRLIKSLD